MLIISIISGILLGYIVGCYVLDRWIENGRKDIDD